MKKSIPIIIAIILTIISFFSCKKETLVSFPQQDNLTAKGTVDYTNPDPTWIQVTSPIFMKAKWYAQFVPTGYTAGISGAYDSDNKIIIPDSIVIIKWHLHVGLRNFNTQLKPDVIDYRYIQTNALEVFKKSIPNGGVQGDYDFIDTVKIARVGYYNSYFPNETAYNWNSIAPGVHSSATNWWVDSPFFTGILK